jgi:2-polyprenyl-3-methyl-5-hydroxy-6-metoxy-1,4-benzoquinol methylase
MPVTPEAIRWAYRLFLDREPENNQVINDKISRLNSISELRQEFINSSEFKQKTTQPSAILSGCEPPMLIEHAYSEFDLQLLFNHIQETWQYLGEKEPHWSVITSEQFLQSNIQNTKDMFYDTGKQEVVRLIRTLDRNGIDYSSYKSCLEYGCGLGRITCWLAERFETVFGYDISKSHLQYAQNYFSGAGIDNINFIHVKNVEDIRNIPLVDLIISVIVLQHNPPPIISLIIKEFVKKLNYGGVAFFQVPTYQEGYGFSMKKYLNREARNREMEMHVLSQHRIFDIVKREGGNIIEVLEDKSTGLGYKSLSNTFLIQKE